PPPTPAEKKNKFFSHKADPPPTPAPKPAQELDNSPIPIKIDAPPKPVTVVVDNSPKLRIVTDPPGAEVRVDGKLVGTSPITTGPLDPGPYHPVIATLQGYAPARKAAKLEPQGVTEVKLNFEIEAPAIEATTPVPAAGVGYLTAATKPAARLIIDG